MKCFHVKTIYESEQTGFVVAIYETKEQMPEGAANKRFSKGNINCFTASGFCLPVSSTSEVELEGNWKEGKYGLQFNVTESYVPAPKTKTEIIAYLSSALICGIGRKTAEQIVSEFGLATLTVMDKTPERLLAVPNITENKLEKIIESYRQSSGLRNVVAALSPFGISVKKAAKIQEAFGSRAYEIVKNKTYALCNIPGFGFNIVDGIASGLGLPNNSPSRIMHCINYVLEQSKTSGHLFLSMDELCKKAHSMLNCKLATEAVAVKDIKERVYYLAEKSKLIIDGNAVYYHKIHLSESQTAKAIAEMIKEENITSELPDIEIIKLGFVLSESQQKAVCTCFSNRLTIITGGPGTGKTTIINAILSIQNEITDSEILLLAPTGRAARRISESTSHPAFTIHSALEIGSDGFLMSDDALTADLIVVDESSMIDMELAWNLFKKIKKEARIIMVGDADQLPSVGAGNVLNELINCGEIPVTVLDYVYRQSETSLILSNAHNILNSKTKLLTGADFEIISSDNSLECRKKIENIFMKAVNNSELNEVQILTPARKKVVCCSDEINKVMQNAINPPSPSRLEFRHNGISYRKGDKVMQTKNKEYVSNGDIGYILDIKKYEKEYVVKIDFGDGRILDYSNEDMDAVSLAYAATIHKSQGSEYDTVIIPVLPESAFMWQRNLIYTAVTRAKKKVYIVGSYKTLYGAIKKNNTNIRNTKLGERIKKFYKELKST